MGGVKEFRFRHEPVILVTTVFAFAALEKFKRAARDGFIDLTGLLQGSVDSHRSCLWRAWHRPHRDCGSRAHECTLFFRYILIFGLCEQKLDVRQALAPLAFVSFASFVSCNCFCSVDSLLISIRFGNA